MIVDSPLDSLAASLYQALLRDLALMPEQQSRPGARNLVVQAARRPTEGDVSVILFLQQWESTALGFGGVGGAALTSAYTVLVQALYTDQWAVYFGGRYAYTLTQPNTQFYVDIDSMNLASCARAPERYLTPEPVKSAQPEPTPKG